MTYFSPARIRKTDQEAAHLRQLQEIGYKHDSLKAIRTWEHKAEQNALAYANGDIAEEEYDRVEKKIREKVCALFGKDVTTFELYINGDPRGYALKLRDDNGNCPVQYKDWGGFVILAPDFN